MEASGRSSTRNAAKLAVYDATMIIANPAHTIPRALVEKAFGVSSPIPEFSNIPQVNHIEELKLNSSSSFDFTTSPFSRLLSTTMACLLLAGVEALAAFSRSLRCNTRMAE
ncbi:unnamed protein product [Rodentolepis nana]|uniref:Uncharacterized protein n=1 Tax=Rodentolepis nana TaxID=102285 RepID=A0A0R3TPZ4_RODNA|nr:unnamed protein product [Rodentolepis nana]